MLQRQQSVQFSGIEPQTGEFVCLIAVAIAQRIAHGLDRRSQFIAQLAQVALERGLGTASELFLKL